MPVRVVRSFLSPAYWGSFFALTANLMLVIVFTYGGLRPEYSQDLSELGALEDYVHIAALLVVFIFVIRFYSAVAIQTYIGDEAALFKAPWQIRIFLFFVFVLLIFLSGLNTFFVSYPFVLLALWICVLQSALSFVCVSIIEIWRLFRPSQIPKSDRNYFASEIMFGGMVLFIIWLISSAGDQAINLPFYKIPMGGIIALMIIIAIHEWVRLYGRRLREQIFALFEELKRG